MKLKYRLMLRKPKPRRKPSLRKARRKQPKRNYMNHLLSLNDAPDVK
jgi:hypothetical protein